MRGDVIPIEIFERICRFAESDLITLAAICRASKLAHHVAVPVLYGSIQTSEDVGSFAELFPILSDRPDLSTHVKLLHIRRPDCLEESLTESMEVLMAQALSHMVNIQHFIDRFNHATPTWPYRVKHNLHVASLRAYDSTLPRYANIIHILQDTLLLARLWVSRYQMRFAGVSWTRYPCDLPSFLPIPHSSRIVPLLWALLIF